MSHSPVLKKLSITFSIFAVGLVLIVLYFLVAKASITITPEVKPTTLDLTFNLVDRPDQTDTTHIVGSTWSRSTTKEQRFSVEHFTNEEEGKASGEVTITNNRSTEQTLVEETRLLTTDGILFRLNNTITIPPQSTRLARATADSAGPAGDIAAGVKMTVPGLSEALQTNVFAESHTAFAGGVVRSGEVTEADINRATETIKQALVEQAHIDYLAEYLEQKGSLGSTAAPELVTETIIDSVVSDVPVGSTTKGYTVTVTGTVKGIAFDTQEVVQKVQSRFVSQLPKGEAFVSLNPDSIIYTTTQDEQGEPLLIVTITGASIITPDGVTIEQRDIAGKNEKELMTYLTSLPGISAVDVSFSPFWVHSVPYLPSRTIIQIAE